MSAVDSRETTVLAAADGANRRAAPTTIANSVNAAVDALSNFVVVRMPNVGSLCLDESQPQHPTEIDSCAFVEMAVAADLPSFESG